jgi:hypothetical protein
MIHTIFRLSIYFLFLIYSIAVYGQKQVPEKVPFKDRIYVGGGLGFSVGSYSSLIDVSPIVGYAISRNFVAGIGLTYKYYRYKDYYYNYDDGSFEDFKTNMYGGSVWTRYFLTDIGVPIIENIYLHAEVEPLLFVNEYTFKPGGNYLDPFNNQYVKGKEQITLTGVFLGGGLRQMVGVRSYLYLEVLYNFNEELYSPYSNPRIRIGFAAGF